MKILVHSHFSFLLKIENNFTTHVSKFIFSFFFCKNKSDDFSISFFQIFKKNENWNLTNSFSVFQKENKMEICFQVHYLILEKKWKLKFYELIF